MPDNNGNNNYNFGISDLEKQIKKGVNDITRSVNAGLHDAGININVDDVYRELRNIGRDITRDISKEFSQPKKRNISTDENTRKSKKTTSDADKKTSGYNLSRKLSNQNKKKISNMRSVSSLYSAIGWIFLFIAAVSILTFNGLITRANIFSHIAISASPFVWIAGSGIMFLLWSRKKGKRIRYSQYLSLTEGADSVNIDDIASASGIDKRKVRREILAMIDAGYFGDSATLNVSENMFYRTKAAAEFSRTAKETQFENEANQKSDGEQNNISTDELDYNDISDFDKITDRIRYLNDEISDKNVSDRIYKIEAVTGHIFYYVKNHPDKFQSIRSFMSYYLPTTLKLLASYSAIEKAGVAGHNMQEAKKSIESTLDMLVDGFSLQLDKLYEEENLDITSDVEVLKQMLHKDGLSRDEFSEFMNGYGENGKQ